MPQDLPSLPPATFADRVRTVGLELLIVMVRARLRAGIHPDAVARWVEDQLIAASARVDAIERGE